MAEDAHSVLGGLPALEKKLVLDDVLNIDHGAESYCYDKHVPNLLALSPRVDVTKTNAYKKGELILQDKASCFPAYLLLGKDGKEDVGDVIDGCAAPGNKTTHLAAAMGEIGSKGKVFACERDSSRSKTLLSMVAKAGADKVEVLAKQDFLAIDPCDTRFRNVTHLLLDPSCSGSGIVGREDIPKLALPDDPRTRTKSITSAQPGLKSMKRKRGETSEKSTENPPVTTQNNLAPDEEEAPTPATEDRLMKLSNLQTRIVEHAMKFPAARRITYSTCSIHEQENEVVVSRLLASRVAQTRGWGVLPRSAHVDGMRVWKHRGSRSKIDGQSGVNRLSDEELDACIRCNPDDEEGTMGFFVCAFVRDVAPRHGSPSGNEPGRTAEDDDDVNGAEEELWEGFD